LHGWHFVIALHSIRELGTEDGFVEIERIFGFARKIQICTGACHVMYSLMLCACLPGRALIESGADNSRPCGSVFSTSHQRKARFSDLATFGQRTRRAWSRTTSLDMLLSSVPDVEQLADPDAESGQDIVAVERGIGPELAGVRFRTKDRDRALPWTEYPDLG